MGAVHRDAPGPQPPVREWGAGQARGGAERAYFRMPAPWPVAENKGALADGAEHFLGTFLGWLKPLVLRCSSNYRLTNLT